MIPALRLVPPGHTLVTLGERFFGGLTLYYDRAPRGASYIPRLWFGAFPDFIGFIFSVRSPKIAFRYIQVLQYGLVSISKLVLELFYDLSVFDDRIGRNRLENVDDFISRGTAGLSFFRINQ